MWQKILKEVNVPEGKPWTISVVLDDDGLEITLCQSTGQKTYKISWIELLKQLHSEVSSLVIPEGELEGLGALFG